MEVEDCREEFSGARQTDGEAHGKARQGKKAGQGKGSIACRERRGRSVTSAMATPYTLRRIRVYRFRGDVTTYYTSNGDTRALRAAERARWLLPNGASSPRCRASSSF